MKSFMYLLPICTFAALISAGCQGNNPLKEPPSTPPAPISQKGPSYVEEVFSASCTFGSSELASSKAFSRNKKVNVAQIFKQRRLAAIKWRQQISALEVPEGFEKYHKDLAQSIASKQAFLKNVPGPKDDQGAYIKSDEKAGDALSEILSRASRDDEIPPACVKLNQEQMKLNTARAEDTCRSSIKEGMRFSRMSPDCLGQYPYTTFRP